MASLSIPVTTVSLRGVVRHHGESQYVWKNVKSINAVAVKLWIYFLLIPNNECLPLFVQTSLFPKHSTAAKEADFISGARDTGEKQKN